MLRRYILCLSMVALSSAAAFGGKKMPAKDQNMAAGESRSIPANVELFTLDNGLEVLLVQKPGLPMTGVNTVVCVGSAYETFATSGMSHMLEHLLFNGTDSLTQRQLYDAADALGAYNNANTSDYYTNFMMVAPRDNFYAAMRLQAAMLFRSTLPEEKFAKEKGIVMEEIAKSLGRPSTIAERNTRATLYAGHALALPTLGTYETIRNMQRDDVYGFYKRYYAPNNMRLSVIGDFDRLTMRKAIEQYYGGYAPVAIELPDDDYGPAAFQPLPTQRSPLRQISHRFHPGANLRLQLFSTLPEGGENAAALLTAKLEMLAGELQDDLKAAAFTNVHSVSLQLRSSPVAMFLTTDIALAHDSAATEMADFVEEWLRQQDYRVAAAELNNTISQTTTAFLQNLEKPHMFGIYHAETIATRGFSALLDQFRGQHLQQGAQWLTGIRPQALRLAILHHPQPSLTTEADTNAVATRFIASDGQRPDLIIRRLPDSELLAIHLLIGNKFGLEQKYGTGAAAVWHRAFKDHFESVLNEENNSQFGVVLTANDNPFIPMDDIYMHPDFAYIRVEGLQQYRREIIALLSGEILNFRLTEDAFNKANKGSAMAAMRRREDKAQTTFQKVRSEIVWQQSEREYSKLDYASCLAFGKSYFSPANMTISVVADAPVATIERDFAALSATPSDSLAGLASWQKNLRMPAQAKDTSISIGGEQTWLFYGYTREISPEDIPALTVLSLLLNDAIVFDIREKRGLAYRMGAGIRINAGRALFYIDQASKPENRAELQRLYPTFFSRDFLGEITQDRVQRAVNQHLGRMQFRRLSSINQGFYLGRSQYLHGDYRRDEEALAALAAVTAADVESAAERYLQAENVQQIVVE
jgi:zinc protease